MIFSTGENPNPNSLHISPNRGHMKEIIEIRKAQLEDFNQIWPIFSEIVSKGDTYAYPSNTTREEGFRLWMEIPREVYIAMEGDEVVGTYYIKTNQGGPGSHVCNCGYMVPSSQREKGIATRMCEHSQQRAVELGYQAMQFNFVASSNQGAVNLWLKLGYQIVGTLPKAFEHPAQGLIDAYVMYKWLK